MPKLVFDFRDYKKFVEERISEMPGKGRGERTRIAEALSCHTAYITHVFKGTAHLSLEQAADLCTYFGLSNEEQHYFLLLVQHARAGNANLRRYLENEIQKVVDARMLLKNRLNYQKTLNDQEQAIYYSSWHYAAIDIAVAIPALRTPEKLSRYFRIPLKKVNEVLQFLVKHEFVKSESGNYRPGSGNIHLGNDSPMISKYHTNWRVAAIQSFDQVRVNDLHYSSVVSLAKADIPRIREILVKAIEEVRKITGPSTEETVCVYALDLFSLGES